jgi:hypothetical protein
MWVPGAAGYLVAALLIATRLAQSARATDESYPAEAR